MSKTPDKKIQKLENITSHIQVCSDFYIGATKILNTKYLPLWSGENEQAYKNRLASTSFLNMFAPVVDGLTGLITKKEPTINGYNDLDLENVDLNYNNLATFMKNTIKKSLIEGISFVSAETDTELNRSFLKRYSYEDLYSYEIKNNVLIQIVFKETVEIKKEEFGIEEQERYVVFKIGGGDVWFIDKKSQNKTLRKQEDASWINSLKSIPVLPIITGKIISDFEVIPKLYDVANLNKVHVNLETNLGNVLDIVGNPALMFFGTFAEGEIKFGVKDALRFTDKTKEGAEYLEVKGTSIGEIQKKIEVTEKQVDKLTYGLLVSENSKTVIDAQQKQSKNTSFLSDVAQEAEVKFSKLLEFMYELENKTVPKDSNLETNKDFDLEKMNLDIAFKLLQAGEMSRTLFYDVLKNGKLPKNFDIEEELALIEREA